MGVLGSASRHDIHKRLLAVSWGRKLCFGALGHGAVILGFARFNDEIISSIRLQTFQGDAVSLLSPWSLRGFHQRIGILAIADQRAGTRIRRPRDLRTGAGKIFDYGAVSNSRGIAFRKVRRLSLK